MKKVNRIAFDTKTEATIERLKKLVLARFKCELELLSVTDSHEIDASILMSDDGDIHFTLEYKNVFLSKAVIYGGSSLMPHDQKDVIELCKAILEPVLYSLVINRNVITNIEETKAETDENVISLFNKKQEREEALSLLHSDSDMDENTDEDYFTTNEEIFSETFTPDFQTHLVILEGARLDLLERTARQIHDLAGHWAMVNYNDIRSHIQSWKDIMDLGPITVFVSDVLDLSPMEREWVLELQYQTQNEDAPLFVVGSLRSLRSLVNSGNLEFHHMERMQRSIISMPQLSLDSEQRKETLELLFLQLD